MTFSAVLGDLCVRTAFDAENAEIRRGRGEKSLNLRPPENERRGTRQETGMDDVQNARVP